LEKTKHRKQLTVETEATHKCMYNMIDILAVLACDIGLEATSEDLVDDTVTVVDRVSRRCTVI